MAAAGDASISHDERAGTWCLAAGGTTLTLALDPSRDLQMLGLTTAANRPWIVGAAGHSSVMVDGRRLAVGSLSSGFVYRSAVARVLMKDQALQLDATFEAPSAAIRITRHYAIVSTSPTFETWTTYEGVRGPVMVSDLTRFTAQVPDGRLRWLSGLQGDSADARNDSAFTLRDEMLAVGGRLSLGAQGRSSEAAVPLLAIDGVGDEFYMALMWSGAWALQADRTADGLSLSFGLAPMTTAIGEEPVEGPHILFGAVSGGFMQVAAAIRSYAVPRLRNGRPFSPLVTFNTWFARGAAIDADVVRGEMLRAAPLGVELFVVDAGWYAGAGAGGRWDFDSGLGSWEPDPVRFPGGLKPLADYAHGLGMKFGIWVEPERVDPSVVGGIGFDERWLATRGGQYGFDRTAQVCFASEAARRWVLDRLIDFMTRVQPDYLKWDNNGWINCDRDGHGHGLTDGNFAHVRGLYGVLAALRERFPQLVIENVSGGGNRLDLGMLRYTDVAWMSDDTVSSAHVRHNVQGLSVLFPPAYLLSFVVESDDEHLHGAADLLLSFRSRMQGALGLSFRNEGFSDADLAAMTAEIGLYQRLRATLQDASASLLSAQASSAGQTGWDVLQERTPDSAVVVTAVRPDMAADTINVKPIGLGPGTMYAVSSADTGPLGAALGADLMLNGIDLLRSPVTAAHVLILSPLP